MKQRQSKTRTVEYGLPIVQDQLKHYMSGAPIRNEMTIGNFPGFGPAVEWRIHGRNAVIMSVAQARWVADACEQHLPRQAPGDPLKLAELIMMLRAAADKVATGSNLGKPATVLAHTIDVEGLA